MGYFQRAVLILLVLLFSGSNLFPQEIENKIAVGGQGGLFKPWLTDHNDIWTLGPLGGLQLKYGAHPNIMLGIHGYYGVVWLADLSGTDSSAGFNFVRQKNAPSQRNLIIELFASYRFFSQSAWQPLVGLGFGMNFWTIKDHNGDQIQYLDKNLKTFPARDQVLTPSGIVGLEYFPAQNFSIEAGWRFHYRSVAFTNFTGSQSVAGKENLDLPKAVSDGYAGFNFYFGKPKDNDKDGVPNRKDKCPNTPMGCRVDVSGCPVDSDSDGICDGLDQCPDTPSGCGVDNKGCPPDADGDQVCDGLDQCPNTVSGCRVDAKGCPIDSDGDRVCDGLDRCPDTPTGCQVDTSGCPVDSDGDGVCDGLDQCPDTPAGTKVDSIGCPIALLEFIPTPEKPLILEGVNFEIDKAVLLDTSKQILNLVAVSLLAHPEVKVEVAGHTDGTGSEAHNLRLSNARANAVRDYLMSQGVSAENLVARGYGESMPVADNKTKEGRAKNRRTELKRLP